MKGGFLAILVSAVACGETAAPELAPTTDAAVTMEPRCATRGPAPAQIPDVVALLNALPKPVTLPCLLEALPHPFAIHAANSILSAQPAVGKRSPRLFLFFDALMLSVVPAGEGAQLLEFGERRSETHTLKAELEFPIEAELDAASPYTRLRFDDDNTTCGFCHAEEDPAEDVGHVYARVSRAIRPMPSQRVSLTELSAELASCDTAAEPDRCATLRAVFGPGRTAVDAEFPAEWKTFF